MRFIVLFILLVPTLSLAEPDAEDKSRPGVQVVVFDPTDVNATGVDPGGALVTVTKRPVFNPLIRLREHFDVEIRQSISNVR